MAPTGKHASGHASGIGERWSADPPDEERNYELSVGGEIFGGRVP